MDYMVVIACCRENKPEKAGLFVFLPLADIRFYEARPVKPKICLIGSTFYPGFHNDSRPSVLWSQLTYAMTPILHGELEAHSVYRAVI
jgi:hypothetical protein